MSEFNETHHAIVSELGTALAELGATSGLMAIVMSWGDTQNSEDTLQMLKDYNENNEKK